jgi:hypothetical protein
MWGSVQEGDWVKATDTLTVGMFGGSMIRPGTKGVVTSVISGWFSSRAAVTFDGEFGTVRATVPVSKLRVVRRGGGVEAFTSRRGRLMAARAGLMIFVAWPVISFVAQYLWLNHGFSGITRAFALGVIDSFGDYLNMLLTSPVRGALYLGFLGLVGRLAWR